MLQGLNLPFVDLASPDNGLNVMLTGPVADAETGASFADIFRMAPERPSIPIAESGTRLPTAGNELPDSEELAPELPESNDLGNIFWSGIVALDPLSLAPRLATSPAIENVMLSTRLATANPPAERIAMQLSLPASEAGSRTLPVLPAPVASSAVDVTPPSLPAASSTASSPGPSAAPSTAASSTAALATPATAMTLAGPAAAPPATSARVEVAASLVPGFVPAAAASMRRTANDGAGRLALAADLPQPPDNRTPELKPAALLPPAQALAPQIVAVPVPLKAEDEVLLTQLSQLQSLPSTPVSSRGGVESAIPPAASLPTIATPVQDSAWGDRLGERLMMMADGKSQFAEIRLTPAELGPLRVRIAIEDGATSVTFHAQHAVTREALEQAMPRLRELFTNNGLTLAESHIADAGEQGMPQGKPGQRDAERLSAELRIDADKELTTDVTPHGFSPKPRSEQLLDTFA